MSDIYVSKDRLSYFWGKVKSYFTAHTGDTTVHITASERTNWNNKVDQVSGKGLSTNDYTTTEKNKLNGIASGAEVNQNAFSNVKVGNTTVAADGKTDTLILSAGSNVTLTPDATNDTVTIAATDTTYESKTAASGGTAVSLVTTGEKYTWNDKQSALTFDNSPTSGSSNPVKSGGVYTALAGKAASSHTHAAGDITSGTLAAARLPAATSSTQGAVKLGASGGAAAYSHTHVSSNVTDLVTATSYGPGTIVTINEGIAGLPIQSVSVSNSGTYLTVYRAGKNLCPMFSSTSGAGITYTVNANGVITANGTTTAAASIAITATLPAGSYCVSGSPDDSRSVNSRLDVYVRVGSNVVARDYKNVSAATRRFTLTEITEITIVCRVYSSAGMTVDNVKFYPQIEVGDTPTTYVAYQCDEWGYNGALMWPMMTSLAGVNNIWASSGSNVTVKYGAFLGVLTSSIQNHYVTAGAKGGTTVSSYATAEGYQTTANGLASHAEGFNTTASGNYGVHAEGFETTVSGDYGAHAEGRGTIAAGLSQHVFGRYNISDTSSVEIVGWGTSSTRKNIRTLESNGNMTIAGTLTQSSDARLKDVQGDIPDVSGIRAVRFKWNDTHGEHDEKDHIGYLAQEVEQVVPFLVKEDSSGYKSLDYIAFLCAKVDWLERRVADLENYYK